MSETDVDKWYGPEEKYIPPDKREWTCADCGESKTMAEQRIIDHYEEEHGWPI